VGGWCLIKRKYKEKRKRICGGTKGGCSSKTMTTRGRCQDDRGVRQWWQDSNDAEWDCGAVALESEEAAAAWGE